MMIYDSSQQLRGSPDRALEFVAATLVSLGFNLEQRTQTKLSATRPTTPDGTGDGRHRAGSSDSPLTTITRIEVSAGGGTLSARARFSTANTVVLTALLGVTALACTFMALFIWLGFTTDRHGHSPPKVVAIVLILIAGFMCALLVKTNGYLRDQGRDAVDALLTNAASSASS